MAVVGVRATTCSRGLQCNKQYTASNKRRPPSGKQRAPAITTQLQSGQSVFQLCGLNSNAVQGPRPFLAHLGNFSQHWAKVQQNGQKPQESGKKKAKCKRSDMVHQQQRSQAISAELGRDWSANEQHSTILPAQSP